MKRYWVFAYLKYYPRGGYDDFQGDFDHSHEALDLAMNFTQNQGYDHAQVLDTEERQLIANFTSGIYEAY